MGPPRDGSMRRRHGRRNTGWTMVGGLGAGKEYGKKGEKCTENLSVIVALGIWYVALSIVWGGAVGQSGEEDAGAWVAGIQNRARVSGRTRRRDILYASQVTSMG